MPVPEPDAFPDKVLFATCMTRVEPPLDTMYRNSAAPKSSAMLLLIVVPVITDPESVSAVSMPPPSRET